MKKSFNTYIAALLVTALGLVVGCDIPEEKKSLFRNAGTEQQLDSNTKQFQEEFKEKKVEEKKEQKKPQPFAKRDHVFS